MAHRGHNKGDELVAAQGVGRDAERVYLSRLETHYCSHMKYVSVAVEDALQVYESSNETF